MLAELNIEPTKSTPKVSFEKGGMILKFKGILIPEDPSSFFKPILKWLDTYELSPKDKMTFEFELDHFNTTAARFLLSFMQRIHKIENQEMIWTIYSYDEDLLEVITNYNELIEGAIAINFK